MHYADGKILPDHNVFCRFFQRPAHECLWVTVGGGEKGDFFMIFLKNKRRNYEKHFTKKVFPYMGILGWQ